MPITFRLARAEELPSAQDLIVRAINDLTERHGFGAMASVRPADFQLFSIKDDPRGLWVAEEDGQIVGSAFGWTCGDLWFLAELFVAPGMQGGGVGRELLRRMLHHADLAGARTRALITFTFNTASQGLYLRHGMFPRTPVYMFSARRMPLAIARSGPPLQFRRAEPCVPHLAALAAIDMSALGVSRKKHHGYLLGDPATKGFLVYEGDDCVGYAYVASSGHVGPLAVSRREMMARALTGALAIAAEGESEQISAFLPGHCEDALRVAADHRMRITLPMVLWSDREFGDWDRYLPRNPGFM